MRPDMWNAIDPPEPRCASCGATPEDEDGPPPEACPSCGWDGKKDCIACGKILSPQEFRDGMLCTSCKHKSDRERDMVEDLVEDLEVGVNRFDKISAREYDSPEENMKPLAEILETACKSIDHYGYDILQYILREWPMERRQQLNRLLSVMLVEVRKTCS